MFSSKLTFATLAILIVFTASRYAGPSNHASQELSAPTSLFWGKNNGISYLTVTRNHNIPQFCTSSWAVASTTVLSDRFKVLRNSSWPDYNISPQVALSCISGVQGCTTEGDPVSVYQYIYQNGITDETCASYQARDFSNGIACDRLAVCKNCLPNGKCDIPNRYFIYNITGFAVAKGVTQMVNALQSGPIVCRIGVTSQFQNYQNGILTPTAGAQVLFTSYVSIVGYGASATGTNYWIGRNSWGTVWGDAGFFNLVSGNDALGVEDYCVYPTPNKTITVVTTNNQGEEKRSYVDIADLHKLEEEPIQGYLRAKPVTEETLSAVPASWVWSDVKGKNYLSWVRNQNIPQYCEASWAFAATSSLTDRFNILIFNDTFPQFTISPQVLLNCGVGNCTGGDPTAVYNYARMNGIPDDTCQQYVGDFSETCNSAQVCQACVSPAPANDTENSVCNPTTPAHLFKVGNYGNLAGVTKMKQEIYNNGPITCGIYASKAFAAYTGGIFKEISRSTTISNFVSVVGWGIEKSTNTEYWVGRNSWGTSWGEYGYFKMQMYRDNLGIETDCTWAIPSF
ncbi:unnamed protein product [Blepharisma stoltei]|uniref:Peptidase C1A papain C-terminal domain-containing protein n=1 Tax=Blepharisma stoltei TaxID=1481888 RepID=A0AAU9JCU2_9CILI|nr:unnamed protein product [Blepharisma stoltei]